MTRRHHQRRTAPFVAELLAGDCVTDDDAGRHVRFHCDDGTDLAMVFAGDTARLLADGEEPIVLARRPVASGFRYDTGRHSIRGEGQSLTYVVGRRAPIACRQVEPGSRPVAGLRMPSAPGATRASGRIIRTGANA